MYKLVVSVLYYNHTIVTNSFREDEATLLVLLGAFRHALQIELREMFGQFSIGSSERKGASQGIIKNGRDFRMTNGIFV